MQRIFNAYFVTEVTLGTVSIGEIVYNEVQEEFDTQFTEVRSLILNEPFRNIHIHAFVSNKRCERERQAFVKHVARIDRQQRRENRRNQQSN